MNKCTIHPHSSDESAARCHANAVGKRADKKLKWIAGEKYEYERVVNVPPRIVKLGEIELYVFAEGMRKT